MTPAQILAEPVRVYLIELLCVCEATSGDLAEMAYERFGIGWSAVSRHLATLAASGFVDCVRDDPTRWYFLADDWLDVVMKPVDDLRRRFAAGVETREIGGLSRLEAVPRAAGVASRRGHRGRADGTTAARGRGRSEFVAEADGGSPE
jgi:DNA-binding transcriptional ArsR family regulator